MFVAKHVAELLKEYRDLAKIDQTAVAKNLRVSVQFYNAIEHGRAPLPQAYYKELVKLLKLKPEWLITAVLEDYREELTKWL